MERYKINRIGFLNYWLYDEEEFYFYDGKLLLRGSNGSGKSVTMVSFFPLLFDGNKNPERFDTFGSRDRKVEDYVLSSDIDANENTSYLYMEFYNKKEDKYLTIGIGLRAIRNRNVEFYGFAITDNRRIKQDFMLYRDSLRKIPLTKRELQSQIGAGGEFVTGTKEYKAMVNRLLFGFENEGLYSELINLMLQLRSPKLSKDYKPTKLQEILSSVLEPISERDILTMSESIENMNKYKEKIIDLDAERNAATSLVNSFYDYSNIILYTKAKNYLEAKKEAQRVIKEKMELIDNIEKIKEELENQNKRLDDIVIALNELEFKESNIDAKEIDGLLKEKIALEEDIKALEIKITNKEDNFNNKDAKRLELEDSIRKANDDNYGNNKEFERLKEELKDISCELYTDDVLFYLDELEVKKENFNFELFFKDLDKEKEKLKNLAKIIGEQESFKRTKEAIEEDVLKEEKNVKKLVGDKKLLSDSLVEEIDALKTKISSFSNNKILLFTKEEIEKMADTLTLANFEELKLIDKIFLDSYKREVRNIDKEINIISSRIQNEMDNIKRLEEQKINVDKILEANLDNDDTKDYLIKNKLEGKYLYEVIEFKDNVSKKEKVYIEKALKKMGILDTFVIKSSVNNSKINLKTFGNFRKEKNSILKYFNIVDNDYKEEVIKILDSISTDNGDISIMSDGTYNIGIITGYVNEDYDLKYIGKSIRDEYIKLKKEEYDKEISSANSRIKELEESIEVSKSNLSILEEEYSNTLDFNEYKKILEELKNLDLKLDIMNDYINSKTEEISDLNKEINRLNEEISFEKKYYKGPLSSEGINKVIEEFNYFKDKLYNLQDIVKSIIRVKEIIETLNSSLEDVRDNLDNIKIELDEIRFEVKNNQGKISKIEEIVNSDKYRDLKNELEKIKKEKTQLEREKENTLIERTKNEKDLELGVVNLEILTSKVVENEVLEQALKKIFEDEYNLKYSNYEEDVTDINKWFRGFKLDKIISINEAYDKFADGITRYIPKLQNYAGRKTYILNYEDDMYRSYTDNEVLQEKISGLFKDARRSDLEFRYGGKTLSLIELMNNLTIELERTQSLLNDEDRKLFEDLLMNNIGDSIRKKIQASNEWIKEVKSLMESMNTSSGLSFSIKWSGKTRESEDELDTLEIVKIFERDPNTLKEEDLQKIINHFRSKITLEEEKFEDGERNYLEIIRNVLDYRKWFYFQLYFKRANNDKKELTDKEFSKFSGGEKAIAMYVPLFAGIYAKFNAAKSDAPRVIALDEAFAGVDDANIEDCFRILESMDLDYVLTSQILWGDYNTVKHLAISELHHLPTTNVVSVIKYKWDGIKRTIVTDNREYETCI